MTEDQIKHMTERFLSWKLPADFNPDAGISFEPIVNLGTVHQYRHEPVGTNLFSHAQAEAMVRYMLEGAASPSDGAAGESEPFDDGSLIGDSPPSPRPREPRHER